MSKREGWFGKLTMTTFGRLTMTTFDRLTMTSVILSLSKDA